MKGTSMTRRLYISGVQHIGPVWPSSEDDEGWLHDDAELKDYLVEQEAWMTTMQAGKI